ncbi:MULTISPECIES: PilZ domain-containing protein [unclassified Colwellia]|uniref:PilZ domain-containing protein n=1 Tax=unclassified Colwellia TaxID=196834 RepID=UPI0015F72262|nr:MULTISPECIES: PilZ domain-containing protein [unclassified Colwellia]MBA6232209.1 PilZ domain-containing protein [Colwellia sp. MB02u-7]MBA6238218.1 PilZ domain-containing protein [Colwellia sp. MB02u-11]MBA6254473.1 PilZ domain-containing protein [Colwellia sp. MB3u-28]MBA6262112.1 PilZ domain-containing protein [Colwellia sp. MB3u-41]MBA6299645.1 PilZ domain-containing protein [Colwellia sp. MB3u-22]
MHQFSLEFLSDRELYQYYMPFVKNGGLFVRTPEHYSLGDDIKLEVTLPDALEASIVIGKVCWLTPIGAQNGTPAGIGVSFDEDKDNVCNQIEQLIGRLLSSSEPTLSM